MEHHLFPGSNTSHGFLGFFEGLVQNARRAVILKGGPGVGKSTLMAQVGRHYREKGYAVTYYHCSGDPDSLDAVAVEENGFLILDGTAPHIVDPSLPGAADGILNLGVCLNEKQLQDQREEISALSREIAGHYARCTRYLRAAAQMRADAAAAYAPAFGEKKRRALQKELMESCAFAPEGKEQRLFAQAITWKGIISRIDDVIGKKTVCLDVPWGFNSDQLLRPLMERARHTGTDFTCYCDPLEPEKIAHLRVGETVFTTAVLLDAPVFSPGLEKEMLSRQSARLSYDKAVYDLLVNQAVEALADAKGAHDSLERYYIDAMDYERLNAIKSEWMEELPE